MIVESLDGETAELTFTFTPKLTKDEASLRAGFAEVIIRATKEYLLQGAAKVTSATLSNQASVLANTNDRAQAASSEAKKP